MIKELSISGFRGFGQTQTVKFSIPDQEHIGSGLTIITGVVIDEPELSVHPALQKRLMALFLEYSKTHQIIVCTHSPYFVNWEAIVNGANLIRVVKEGLFVNLVFSKPFCQLHKRRVWHNLF